MDLVATLRAKLEKLPAGDHSSGLDAVSSHIETAFAHLSRGQRESDDSAYTDVIYRTNQAFEGSIKEAYRVLAGKDPSRQRPFDIENYLESNGVFRERVLAQFTNYRTEWRNPSTHDYKLDFDESEAFLAIVAVAAFACVLIDQVASKLAFTEVATQTESEQVDLRSEIQTGGTPLIDVAAKAFAAFAKRHDLTTPIETEIQLIGALSGFLSTVLPSVKSLADYRLKGDTHERVDLFLESTTEKLIVELKRHTNPRVKNDGIAALQRYMAMTDIHQGILFLYAPTNLDCAIEEHTLPDGNGRIVIVTAPRPA